MNPKQICEMNVIITNKPGYCHACSCVDKNTKRWKGAWANKTVNVWFNLYKRTMCIDCYEIARLKRISRREKLAAQKLHQAKNSSEFEVALEKYFDPKSRKRAYPDKDTETELWRDIVLDEHARRGTLMEQFDIRTCYISDEDI